MATITGTSGNDTNTSLSNRGTPLTQDADDVNLLGGNDNVSGLGGNDTIRGAAGSDSLNGSAGADSLSGQGGNDSLQGGAGADSLNGGVGADSLSGEGGNDSVIGGTGNDSTSGGIGNDTLIGVDSASGFGAGELDTLTGDAGSDRFVLGQGTETFYDNNGDSDYALITDFSLSQDVIQLRVVNSDPSNVNELGDAGQLLSDARVIPPGTATLDTINGQISSDNDADLFQINLTGGTFSATTGENAVFDTQLFLFDEDGTLIAENDDTNNAQSTLSESSLDAGTYFLGISSFNNDPNNPLTGFDNNGSSNGDYSIEVTGVQSGSSTAFSLGASPNGLPSGTAISFGNDLIAIVQGDAIPDFSSGFDFV